jgi:hypothetical protein
VPVLANDQNVEPELSPNVTLVGGPTGPVTTSIQGDELVVTSAAEGSGAWSQTYRVETVGGIDTAVASGQVTAEPEPPPNQPPTKPSLSASNVTETSARLSWSAATDPDGTVESYVLRRNGAVLTAIAAPTTAFTDTTLQPGTTYRFTVEAIDDDAAGSGPSNQVTFTTPTPPPPPPPPGPTPEEVTKFATDLERRIAEFIETHNLRELTGSAEDIALGKYLGVPAPGGFVIDAREGGGGVIGYRPEQVLQFQPRSKPSARDLAPLIRSLPNDEGFDWRGYNVGRVPHKIAVLQTVLRTLEGGSGADEIQRIIDLYEQGREEDADDRAASFNG